MTCSTKNPTRTGRRVSCIVPAHNSEAFIRECLLSILGQSYEDLDVVVVDDASTDRTVEVVGRIAAQDPRVMLLSNFRNEGAAFTRNRALRRAQGRYVAFCDADDLWLPGKLDRQVTFMEGLGAGFSFTAYRVVDMAGRPTGRMVDLDNRESVDYEDMLRKKATIGCSTVILDRATVGEVEMPPIRTGQDYATWLDVLKRGHRAHCLNEVLTEYRLTPGSLSRNKLKKAARQWKIYRRVEGLGPAKSALCFLHYAYRAVVRP